MFFLRDGLYVSNSLVVAPALRSQVELDGKHTGSYDSAESTFSTLEVQGSNVSTVMLEAVLEADEWISLFEVCDARCSSSFRCTFTAPFRFGSAHRERSQDSKWIGFDPPFLVLTTRAPPVNPLHVLLFLTGAFLRRRFLSCWLTD